MLSYVYMKVLERAPLIYDRGIDLVSLGQAGRTIDAIVGGHVRRGMRVLDIGCGTGKLAVRAARVGAVVTGIDASPEMLSAAGEKVRAAGLGGEIELLELGVLDMDEHFDDKCFDLIVSTLVFSELARDERTFTLRECRRLLDEGGTLVIADETRPGRAGKRALYGILRAPLALLTLLLARSGTRAVPDLEGLLRNCGFEIREIRRTRLESFTLAVASPEEGRAPAGPAPSGRVPPAAWRGAAEAVAEHLFRWFPVSVEPGLETLGNPGRQSPVLVTSNYSLTGKRLRKALEGTDCYVLAASTRGINCWCSAADGTFSVESIRKAVKASRVAELVDNRRLVLPQLCAPGVNRREVERSTGWQALFGPVSAADIPRYLESGCSKDPGMCIYRFAAPARADLALAMNFIYYLPAAAGFKASGKKGLARFSLLFWSLTLADYLCFPWLPTPYGLTKSLVCGSLAGGAIACLNPRFKGRLGDTRKAVLTCLGLSLMLGLDLAGITGVLRDEPMLLLYRLGFRKLGPWTVHPMRVPVLEPGRCTGCGSCRDVCPRGVYALDAATGVSVMVNRGACEMCRACVTQCPAGAITITGGGR